MNLMKRAAQIRRASGNRIAMPAAVKKAAAEMRAKKKKSAKPARKRAKRPAATGKSAPKKLARVKRVRSKKTVASLTSGAKRLLLDDIGSLEARKFAARLKRDKNKIQKKISEKKALFRKLS